MLKEVMLGSGGIMLAAAIFASSVAPGANPAPAAPIAEAPVVVAPPAPVPQRSTPKPVQIFPDDSGTMDFGAPMIEATPVETGFGNPAPASTNPADGEASGGRQFNAQPGRSYPIPR